MSVYHKRGWLQVQLDGETVLHMCIFREEYPAVDFFGGEPLRRTQFGQFSDNGRSYWRHVTYSLKNPKQGNFYWTWTASSGELPDQYQRNRLIQIHRNHPDQRPWPDHGYSSWIQRPDGSIFLVDYSNAGDTPDTAHLVGVNIEIEYAD